MHPIQFQFHESRYSKPINLYCFTDVHIGAEGHDKKKFQAAVKRLKEDKDGVCFFNGDTLEFIPPNYGIAECGQEFNVNEQLDAFYDLLAPIKKKILFIRAGNHEERCLRLSGHDPIKRMARSLDLCSFDSAYSKTDIYIKKKKYSLVSTHGAGGSKQTIARLKNICPSADIYFVGHTHEIYCNATHSFFDTSSGKAVQRNTLDIAGGSFLAWSDYAKKKNMIPTTTGHYVLRLDENGITHRQFISF